jgi:hypothetical protein
VKVTSYVSPPLTWHISQVVVNCLFCFVTTCVLNHSCGYWLLSDVLHMFHTIGLLACQTLGIFVLNVFFHETLTNSRTFWPQWENL